MPMCRFATSGLPKHNVWELGGEVSGKALGGATRKLIPLPVGQGFPSGVLVEANHPCRMKPPSGKPIGDAPYPTEKHGSAHTLSEDYFLYSWKGDSGP